MSAPFSRSTRLLETDTLHPSKMTLLLAVVLLGCWSGWFFFTDVALHAISDTADLEVDRASHPVEAQFTGRIVNSHLALDKEVKADEVLVELDAKPQKLQLDEQQAQLAAVDPQSRSIETEINSEKNAWYGEQQSAIEALEEARAHYREGEAAARFAQHEAERLRKMYTAGIAPEVDYNRALADAQQRQAAADSLRFAISRLDREQRTREGDRLARHSAKHGNRDAAWCRPIGFTNGRRSTRKLSSRSLLQRSITRSSRSQDYLKHGKTSRRGRSCEPTRFLQLTRMS